MRTIAEVVNANGHPTSASVDSSPDGQTCLVVQADTEQTESGPTTYSSTRFRLTVYDLETGERLIDHRDHQMWNDGWNRSESGLDSWKLHDHELELHYLDRSVTKLVTLPATPPPVRALGMPVLADRVEVLDVRDATGSWRFVLDPSDANATIGRGCHVDIYSEWLADRHAWFSGRLGHRRIDVGPHRPMHVDGVLVPAHELMDGDEVRLGELVMRYRVIATPASLAPAAWELRRHVALARDDLAARSVYADYLLQHGDRAGELVSLQLAAARTTDATERAQLAAAATALLPEVEAFVVGVAPRPAVRWTIRRGFVEAIAVVGAAIVRDPRGLERLLQLHPIREVSFVDPPTDAARAVVEEQGLAVV